MLYRLPPTADASTLPPFLVRAPVRSGNNHKKRRHRSSRRHFDNGVRRSVRRAFDAAGLYLAGIIPTLAAAAETCAVAKHYVAAAVTILRLEDSALEAAILDGRVQLLSAARAMAPAANLIAAYRAADGADKFILGRAVTTGTMWNELISPLIGEDNTNRKEVAATS
jgi:hypothetical protein